MDLERQGLRELTSNKDPGRDHGGKRVDFNFTRQDGVKVRGRITLPTNYQPGTRVPAVFWDYPREFEDGAAYWRGAIRARNANSYSPLVFLRWSDIWVTQGYALVHVDIPILGKEGRFNDNFRPHLVDTIYSAIRTLAEMGYIDVNRLGHGGHSYGACTTGNPLAHTPFFKAASPAMALHRTLTPMTFQGNGGLLGRAATYTNLAVLLRRSDPAPLLMTTALRTTTPAPSSFIRANDACVTGLGKPPRCTSTRSNRTRRGHRNFLDLWRAGWSGSTSTSRTQARCRPDGAQ